MPWPLFNCALQSSCRVGSTYFYLDTPIQVPWQSVYSGANTVIAYTGAGTAFGHPGFLSSNVPGPVIASPGNSLTGPSTNVANFSWINAEKAYTYIQKSYNGFNTMSQKMPGDMTDCACFATIGTTSFSDDISNQALGVLSPVTVTRIDCSSRLPRGMCGSAVLTWRSHDASGITYVNSNHFKLSTYTQNALQALMSVCISPPGTTVQVLEASKKTISSYVYEQLGGGYEWLKPQEEQLVDLLQEWVVGSPTVQRMSGAAITQMTRALPNWVSADSLVSFMSPLGWPAVKFVAAGLVGKMIGLSSRGNRANEL